MILLIPAPDLPIHRPKYESLPTKDGISHITFRRPSTSSQAFIRDDPTGSDALINCPPANDLPGNQRLAAKDSSVLCPTGMIGCAIGVCRTMVLYHVSLYECTVTYGNPSAISHPPTTMHPVFATSMQSCTPTT